MSTNGRISLHCSEILLQVIRLESCNHHQHHHRPNGATMVVHSIRHRGNNRIHRGDWNTRSSSFSVARNRVEPIRIINSCFDISPLSVSRCTYRCTVSQVSHKSSGVNDNATFVNLWYSSIYDCTGKGLGNERSNTYLVGISSHTIQNSEANLCHIPFIEFNSCCCFGFSQ